MYRLPSALRFHLLGQGPCRLGVQQELSVLTQVIPAPKQNRRFSATIAHGILIDIDASGADYNHYTIPSAGCDAAPSSISLNSKAKFAEQGRCIGPQ